MKITTRYGNFVFAILIMFTSLIFLLLFTVFYYSNRNGIYFQAVAQATGSPDLAKVLVDNAIQALQGGDISKSILHTQAASQELLILESGYDVYSRTTIQALSKLLQKRKEIPPLLFACLIILLQILGV